MGSKCTNYVESQEHGHHICGLHGELCELCQLKAKAASLGEALKASQQALHNLNKAAHKASMALQNCYAECINSHEFEDADLIVYLASELNKVGLHIHIHIDPKLGGGDAK